MLVPTAENDRFRFFRRGSVVDPCGRVDTRPYEALLRRGSVVDPCGRVDTRPYEAGGRRTARGYAPLQGASAALGQAALRIGLLLPNACCL